MTLMAIQRRKLILAASATVAAGGLLHSPAANAFPWLTAAQLAITAVGAFTKSDSGLGAYLGALQQLAEENIRLSQTILSEIGEVQQTLSQMPGIMAEAFITNNEFLIREDLQYSLDAMKLVTASNPLSLADKSRLEKIVEKCSGLAAKRYLPYGRRGVAATCAPIAAALDVHSRKLLGRNDEIGPALRNLYIDWLNQILDFTSKDSLVGLMQEQSKIVNKTVQSQVDRISQELPALSTLITSISAAGLDQELSDTIACLETKNNIGNYCKPLQFQDVDAWGNCLAMGGIPSEVARIEAQVKNSAIPMEGNPTKTRPALSIAMTVKSGGTCGNVVLGPPDPDARGAVARMNDRIGSIIASSKIASDAIDGQRAALVALFQLYTETKAARTLLINRLHLEDI